MEQCLDLMAESRTMDDLLMDDGYTGIVCIEGLKS